VICLSVQDLSVNFGGLRAVDGVSFTIEAGRIHGLIGPNGAGKTTIFNCVTGFYRPTRGSIRFLEHDITLSWSQTSSRLTESGALTSLMSTC
jgi:branched-chain amino acid transport system ATP-binding protein